MQKGIGADYVNNFAGAMRQAANHFDSDVPVAGTYMRKAADQIETAADALREGNFSDLVQGAQRFARSQPTAFFGLALLAGFGAVRFLKSASSEPGRNVGRSPEFDRHAETSSSSTGMLGCRQSSTGTSGRHRSSTGMSVCRDRSTGMQGLPLSSIGMLVPHPIRMRGATDPALWKPEVDDDPR